MRKYKTLFSAVLTLSSFFVAAQNLKSGIAGAFSKFNKDAQFRYAISSLSVLDAASGEIIFSENADMGLAPASTLKTVTAASAFHLLGSAYTWQTFLKYSGEINNSGILNGDIIIQGTGDPTLGSDRFSETKPEVILKRWIDAVRKAGIKRINGRVLADDRLFGTETIPIGWIWQDIGNYYGAGASAVNWNENEFGLVFKPGSRPGEPVKLLRTEPAMPGIRVVNEVTTGKAGSGDNVYAYSAPYSDIVCLRGTYAIDLRKTIMASVPDPALYAASRLAEALKKAGIAVDKPASTFRIADLHNEIITQKTALIDTYTSPESADIIYWLNQKSINLYAEALLKTIALKNGKAPTALEGAEIITDFWNKKLNIDKRSLSLLDGSGLSPENRVSTLSVAEILQSVRKEPWFDHFYKSLPVYNNMKMKSGSMRNVLAYAGYHTNRQGRKLVFSFIVNNYNGSSSAVRQKVFNLLDELK